MFKIKMFLKRELLQDKLFKRDKTFLEKYYFKCENI